MAEEKKIATGYIGNALRSAADNHTTTFSDEIFDTERQKYQNEVNTELETKIAEEKTAIMGTDRIADGAVTLDKIAHESVDDEPTVGSDNLVKSGGVSNKISELAKKMEDIEHKNTNNNEQLFEITSDDYDKKKATGEVYLSVTSNGVDAKNLKSNGKEVVTEHQPLDEYAKKTDIPDVSGFVTQSEIESKQDKIEQIKQETIRTKNDEMILVSDDYNEETNYGEVYGKISNKGISAKGFYKLDGTPIGGNSSAGGCYDIVFASFDSLPEHKAKADIICGEEDAQEKIQTALNDWYANNSFNSGRFLFLTGTYYITHFIEPTGDDAVHGTPYGILMPRGMTQSGTGMQHYPTSCSFEGNNIGRSVLDRPVFEVKPDAYLLKSDGSHVPLTDYKDEEGVFATYTDKENRYLVDNKRYSVIRCVSDPANSGGSMWCSYLMVLKNLCIRIGADSARTLTNYPIVCVDGIYTSAMIIEGSAITAASMFRPQAPGADDYNEGFCGIRGTQGQSWGTHCRIKSVSTSGFFHGIEFGGEHWLIEDFATLQNHVGIAFGCYHDTYGSGHVNVFTDCALERNTYPMYFYHNGNTGWIDGRSLYMTAIGTEWYKYVYGGEKTTGCHIEDGNKAPFGFISYKAPTNTQLFDIQSQVHLFACKLQNEAIYHNNLYSNLQNMVGEQGQIVYLRDKECFAIWKNQDKTLSDFGSWLKISTTNIN